MQQPIPLLAPITLALALSLAGTVQAAGEPRVMFVSKTDKQPMLIDIQGKEMPARKGAVIPPGFTVMVPEGATVQIMTPEKGILAVRPNTLLRVDGIGGDANPYKLTLNRGGVRVANPESKFKKFEIDTPNAKVNFSKGDHETYFLAPGKLKDGRWGTFARGSKDETTIKTRDGDLKLNPREIGHVPGGEKSKPTIITLNASGKGLQDPMGYQPGSRETAVGKMTENFQNMGGDSTSGGSETSANSRSPGASDPLPGLKSYKPPSDLSTLTKLAVTNTSTGNPRSKIDVATANLQAIKVASSTDKGSKLDTSRDIKDSQTALIPTPDGARLARVKGLEGTVASTSPEKAPITIPNVVAAMDRASSVVVTQSPQNMQTRTLTLPSLSVSGSVTTPSVPITATAPIKTPPLINQSVINSICLQSKSGKC